MAHFQKSGSRVSNSTLSAPGGKPFDIGVWGPMNTFVTPNQELTVGLQDVSAPAKFEKVGQISNSVRTWRISGLDPGTWTIAILDATGQAWDTLKLRVAGVPQAPAVSGGGGITWEQMFGHPYDGTKVDLRTKRASSLCPTVKAFLPILARRAIKPSVAAQGPGNGAVTPHTAGAAIDIFYHAGNERSRAYAHGLLKLFIKHKPTMQWSLIDYNGMSFDSRGVGSVNDNNSHIDHIHIDWIDYKRSKLSKEFTSFPYIDDRGNEKIKTIGKFDQWVEMRWNAGAVGASLGPISVDMDAFDTSFDGEQSNLASLRLPDFQAIYHG